MKKWIFLDKEGSFGIQSSYFSISDDDFYIQDPIKYEITTSKVNDKQVTSFLKIMDLTHMDNGTYLCHGENEYDIDVAILHNLVLDKPRVNIHKVVPVATDKIYFNWTVTDWNSPVTDYFLSVRSLLLKPFLTLKLSYIKSERSEPFFPFSPFLFIYFFEF